MDVNESRAGRRFVADQLTLEQSRALDETGLRHKEDAIAVWEYLDRTIDLPAIARALVSKSG